MGTRRILITGGSGFIGSSVIRRLSRDEPTARIVSLGLSTHADAYRRTRAPIQIEHRSMDIGDLPAVRRLFETYEPDKVIHLAAKTHVDRSIRDPIGFVRTNVLGTCNLLEASTRHFNRRRGRLTDGTGFRFLYLSTNEVYGASDPGTEANEDAPHRPNSPYSASKASAGNMVLAWHKTYGLPVVIASASNTFGPQQHPEKLIPRTIANAVRENALPVYGTGHATREWLFVDDLANGLISVLRHGAPGTSYNFGPGAGLRNIDVVRQICRLVDESAQRSHRSSEALIRFVRDRPGHVRRFATSYERAANELSWKPKHSFEEGLRKTVRWYLKNRQWWEPLLDEHVITDLRKPRSAMGPRHQGPSA